MAKYKLREVCVFMKEANNSLIFFEFEAKTLR